MAKRQTTRKKEKEDFRLPKELIQELEAVARVNGFANLEAYIQRLHSDYLTGLGTSRVVSNFAKPKRFYSSKSGTLYHGDSLGLLYKTLKPASVDLIVTSPPFALVHKKDYGNHSADEYLAWFADFANGFKRVLKDTGSLVIDIGGAWRKGSPTKSLYQFKLLVMLCEQMGFKLAQDLYWWNPARMPSPASWVTVKRIRLTDAVNCIWWLSKSDTPKADNRKVLSPYKASQRQNIAKKTLNPNEPAYNEGARPSGYTASKVWAKDNGGAIAHSLIAAADQGSDQGEPASTLLALANTHSNDAYRRYCRDQGLSIHPAPFPAALPAFFIRMLTDPGDVVLDPFAGSCVTGAVAKQLKRNWICCELNEDYVKGGKYRIEQGDIPELTREPKPYTIYPSGMFQPGPKPNSPASKSSRSKKASKSQLQLL